MHHTSPPAFTTVEPLEARIAPAALATIDLADVDSATGVEIRNPLSTSEFGREFSSAGDLNGDGHPDVMVSAFGGRSGGGEFFLIFGKEGGIDPNLDLTALDGTNGFRIKPTERGFKPDALSSADVNDDGFTDLLIGSPSTEAGGGNTDRLGAVYVVYGKASPFPAALMLSDFDGVTGFKISGASAGDRVGVAVSAGDLNGDGIADIIVGADGVDNGGVNAGAVYVVYGQNSGFPATVPLSTLDGINGFALLESELNGLAGVSLHAGGDVNGDGIDDLLIGAPNSGAGGLERGAVYLILGRSGLVDASLSLDFSIRQDRSTSLDSPTWPEIPESRVFTASRVSKILGLSDGDRLGTWVAIAGDLNQDGVDDMLLGAPGADEGGIDRGAAYVVFGALTPSDTWRAYSLIKLGGDSGFRLFGEADFAQAGSAVGAAGDVNGDGLDDIAIGAPGGGDLSGKAYVLYGSTGEYRDRVALASLEGQDGFSIARTSEYVNSLGSLVGPGGDHNGDGFDDLLIRGAGVYVVNGFSSADAPTAPSVVVAANGKSATFTDWDGDLVKIKTSKGKLDASQFVLSLPNSETGGARLLYADFTAGLNGAEFAKTNLTFSAKKGPNGGDGLVDVGSLDATGTVLGKVVVEGDLQEVDASAVKALSVQSFGRAGAADLYGDVGLVSAIGGSLGALEVKTIATGITISAEIFGAVKLQDVNGATLLASGKTTPLKPADAIAIKSITAGGNVQNSRFLAGYDAAGVGVNADVQIGKVLVKGQWRASDLIAGITAGDDGFFGTGDANEVLIAGGGEIIAKIAGITIKGGAFGSDSWGDAFAFSAEEIGSLKVADVKVPLAKGASNDSDLLLAGTTDVWIREA